MYGSRCFENYVPVEETCDCPIECNTLKYSFTIESIPFNKEAMCPSVISYKKSFKFEDFLMKPFYTTIFPPKIVRHMIRIKNNLSDDDFDYLMDDCKKKLQYMAVVNFRLATDSMSVTVMSKRLSFFDKLSGFGKRI